MAFESEPANQYPENVPVDDGRAAGRGGLSLLVLQSGGRLLGLAFVVAVTRKLIPAEFGRYSTVAGFVVLGNFVADFGTSSAMTRMVSRRPADADRLLSGTAGASLVLGLFAYGVVMTFAALNYPSTLVHDMAIGAMAIPCASVLSSLLGALDGLGLISRRALITAIQTLLVASGALPVILGGGVRNALICLAIAPAVCLVLAAVTLRRAAVWTLRLRLDRECIGALFRASLPFALTGGLSALSMRFDVVLLSLVSTPAETAKYDLALRLLESGTYLSTALTAPLFFLLSRRLGSGDREGASRAFHEALRAIYLLALPVSAGVLLLAHSIVGVALGPGYGAVATPLAIMGAAQWLAWLTYAQGSLIMAGDHVRPGIAVAALLTAITLALDGILIPTAGSSGAAAAMVAAWALSAVAFHQLHKRTVGISTRPPSARVLGATALMALAIFPLRNMWLPIPVLVGAVVYGVGICWSGGVTATDRQRVVTLLRRTSHRTSN